VGVNQSSKSSILSKNLLNCVTGWVQKVGYQFVLISEGAGGMGDRKGQTFSRFFAPSRQGRRPIPTPEKNVLYLIQLGDMDPNISQILVDFLEAWYGCLEVRLLASIPGDTVLEWEHRGKGDYFQLKTTPIHDFLETLKPPDAFAIVGFTNFDLYPKEDWNFVFGQAYPKKGTGIFSFCRYETEDKILLQRRCCLILGHETGHLFGIAHCIFYECMMNGVNHLGESDTRPFYLCPVDLRKLHYALRELGGLDLINRFRNLLEFFRRYGWEEEERWYQRIIERIENLKVQAEKRK
jgi:archaemetzincin